MMKILISTKIHLAKTSRADAKSSLRKIGASISFAPDHHHYNCGCEYHDMMEDDKNGNNCNKNQNYYDDDDDDNACHHVAAAHFVAIGRLQEIVRVPPELSF